MSKKSFIIKASNWASLSLIIKFTYVRYLHLHLGANSLKNPLGRQVRMLGPMRRLPSPQRYSIVAPTSVLEARTVELTGRSGFPQESGRCWHIKFSLLLQLVSDQRKPFVPSKREQFSCVPGKFQKDNVTSFPLIHFQLFWFCWSRTTPSQYWPCLSFLWRRYSSQLRKPCRAGDIWFTKEPPRFSQNVLACAKFICWWL